MKTPIMTGIITSYTVRGRLFCVGLLCNRRLFRGENKQSFFHSKPFWYNSLAFSHSEIMGRFVTVRLFLTITN